MRYIEVLIEKGKVFLTIEEVTLLLNMDKKLANQLLLKDTIIFMEGLKRAKYFDRYEKQKRRERQKAFGNI